MVETVVLKNVLGIVMPFLCDFDRSRDKAGHFRYLQSTTMLLQFFDTGTRPRDLLCSDDWCCSFLIFQNPSK